MALTTRELLTICIVSALGGCESQVKAHVRGNINVGNDKESMIAAITHCLPYMGFPRTLNALACINEIIPEN
jgi:4-carboxymuconolactone decarboxylase